MGRACAEPNGVKKNAHSKSITALAREQGKIVLVGVKNKWKKPATGGWCCGQLYFYFEDDPDQHICELQIVHREMETLRKGIPSESYVHDSLAR